jgi:hypothetical protein
MAKKIEETPEPVVVENEGKTELYYSQTNNITVNAAEGSTVNVHINQSGEPRNEPPRP